MKTRLTIISICSKGFLSYLIVAAIITALGIIFRLYPVIYNNRAQEQKLARLIVYSNMRNHAVRQIESEHPDIHSAEKIERSEKLFRGLLESEKSSIRRSIAALTTQRQHYNKFYLLGSDPYYYLYLTKKLLTSGTLSDDIKYNKFFDRLMLAPVGMWRHIELHPYAGLMAYKVLGLFKHNISLTHAVSAVPILLFIASVVIFLAICFLLSKDKVVILISGIFFSLSPIFLQRSSLGWYDTDPYIIIFSLASVLVFLRGSQSNAKYSWVILLGALSGVFYLFWQGATLLPFYIVSAFTCLILYKTASGKSPLLLCEQALLYILVLLLSLCVFITPGGLIMSFSEIMKMSKNFLSGSINAWPDMFIMVGELKTPSFQKIAHLLGGYIFIGISFYGSLLLASKKANTSKEQSIILTVFIVLSLLLAVTAERLVLMLMPFASISFVSGMEKINTFLQKKFTAICKGKALQFRAVFYALLCSLLLSPLIYGHATAVMQNPVFNPAWESSLEKIKIDTPANSIIYTWWPPGHFIKAIAERGVPVDGATFEHANSYWIARAFLAETEKEALGIFTMLDSAGNNAADFLQSSGLSLSQSISLINKLVVSSKYDAARIIGEWVDDDGIKSFMPMMFSPESHMYCLVYNEMLENVLGFYFLKHWDFEQASKAENVNIAKKYSEEYAKYLWSLSKQMPYVGRQQYQSYRTGDILYFTDGISVDIKNLTAEFRKLEGRITGIPKSIIYEKQGRLEEKILHNASTNISIMLIKEKDNIYSCIAGSSVILQSVLFRLYYLNGAGLQHFQKIIDENHPVFNTRVLVYKID
jgi:dolichyl-phosphooligosaccharide-protein glycotransferase